MKPSNLFFTFLIFFSICGCATLTKGNIKLDKNEVDKFSGQKIVETRMEQLCFSNNFFATEYRTLYISIRKVNNNYVMPVNIVLSSIEKYVDDSGVTFLLEDGNTVTLYTSYTGLGTEKWSINDKWYLFSTVLNLSENDVKQLSEKRVTDIRIRYLGGMADISVAEKRQDMIIRMLEAVNK